MRSKKVSMELLSETPNSIVVRYPGRKFPGIILQGDSLASILSMVKEIRKGAQPLVREETVDTMEILEKQLTDYLKIYESTLVAYGIRKPYELKLD